MPAPGSQPAPETGSRRRDRSADSTLPCPAALGMRRGVALVSRSARPTRRSARTPATSEAHHRGAGTRRARVLVVRDRVRRPAEAAASRRRRPGRRRRDDARRRRRGADRDRRRPTPRSRRRRRRAHGLGADDAAARPSRPPSRRTRGAHDPRRRHRQGRRPGARRHRALGRRRATAQLVLEPATSTCVAELAGYQTGEAHASTSSAASTSEIEIAFTKKLDKQRPDRGPATGRLTRPHDAVERRLTAARSSARRRSPTSSCRPARTR